MITVREFPTQIPLKINTKKWSRWLYDENSWPGVKRNAKSDEEMFILAQRNNEQGHPTSIFGKYLSRKTIWDLEFSEHLLYSLACLPPRIFEHLKNGKIAGF